MNDKSLTEDEKLSPEFIIKRKQVILLISPFIIIPSMFLAFYLSHKLLGNIWGHLLGFSIYWIIWCLVFPIALIGLNPIKKLFVQGRRLFTKKNIFFIILAFAFPLTVLFYIFIPNVSSTPLLAIFAGTLQGMTHGPLEELLWRGLYINLFPKNFFLAFIYPTLFFTLWHIPPAILFRPNPMQVPGGYIGVLSGALVFGICYGLIAWRTKSIKWPAILHAIMGFLALSGTMYFQ